MFREIRNHERITDRFETKEEKKGFMQIKPEVEMSMEEIKNCVLQEFEKAAREAAEAAR